MTLRRPTENDVFLRALGAEPGPLPGREATLIRTSTETALRITPRLDGSGRSHVATGIGFLDHLLTLLAFHAGFDLDCVAGGDLEVDEHHTVEDVLAAFGDALQQALGTREGVARYGSAVVPMDEARATAAVDLVRRAHAEISLAFTGDRVGGLALSLLPHALERFTMEAGCTVHVEAAGADDHHIAEAAFKALGSGAAAGRRAGRRRHPLDQGNRMRVVLADYGAGNLRSVTSAFARAGAEAAITHRPGEVREAPLAVIAGSRPRRERRARARGQRARRGDSRRVAAGRPVLGICVGMQLLFGASEEGGSGLALLPGPVRRIRARRVPHMGWNALSLPRPSLAPRRPRRGRRLLRAQLRRRARRRGRRRRRGRSRRSHRRGRPAGRRGRRPVPSRAQRPCRRPAARERAGMVKKRVIPCLDVAGGRVVKGVNFVDLREMGEPIELATRYSELGADELVFLDITATLEGRGPILELIERAAAELTIPFTVGGGVTGLEDARSLLRAGADKVVGQPRRVRRPVDPHRARRRVRLPGGRLRDRRAGG